MSWKYLKMAGYVAVPLVLWLLPADFFDEGRSLCVSQVFFGQSCLGCGMTRAVMHLIHGDIAGAVYYNKLSFVVFPLISIIWASGFYREWKKPASPE